MLTVILAIEDTREPLNLYVDSLHMANLMPHELLFSSARASCWRWLNTLVGFTEGTQPPAKIYVNFSPIPSPWMVSGSTQNKKGNLSLCFPFQTGSDFTRSHWPFHCGEENFLLPDTFSSIVTSFTSSVFKLNYNYLFSCLNCMHWLDCQRLAAAWFSKPMRLSIDQDVLDWFLASTVVPVQFFFSSLKSLSISACEIVASTWEHMLTCLWMSFLRKIIYHICEYNIYKYMYIKRVEICIL